MKTRTTQKSGCKSDRESKDNGIRWGKVSMRDYLSSSVVLDRKMDRICYGSFMNITQLVLQKIKTCKRKAMRGREKSD